MEENAVFSEVRSCELQIDRNESLNCKKISSKESNPIGMASFPPVDTPQSPDPAATAHPTAGVKRKRDAMDTGVPEIQVVFASNLKPGDHIVINGDSCQKLEIPNLGSVDKNKDRIHVIARYSKTHKIAQTVFFERHLISTSSAPIPQGTVIWVSAGILCESDVRSRSCRNPMQSFSQFAQSNNFRGRLALVP